MKSEYLEVRTTIGIKTSLLNLIDSHHDLVESPIVTHSLEHQFISHICLTLKFFIILANTSIRQVCYEV